MTLADRIHTACKVLRPSRPTGAAMIGAAQLERAAGVVASVALAPARALLALESSLRSLDQIAVGVEAMHGQFIGMRADIRSLSGQIDGLIGEVGELGSPVEGIYAEMPKLNRRVEEMDARFAQLAADLAPVGQLAGRFGGRGRRGRPLPSGPRPPELPG